MPQYDPDYIQRCANRLYTRATAAVVTSTVLGLLIGFILAPMLVQNLPAAIATHVSDWMVAVSLAAIGLSQGLERSFTLRLQAQAALCQREIEQNTRRPAGSPEKP